MREYTTAFTFSDPNRAKQFFQAVKSNRSSCPYAEVTHQFALVHGSASDFVATLIQAADKEDEGVRVHQALNEWFKTIQAGSYDDWESLTAPLPGRTTGDLRVILRNNYQVLETVGAKGRGDWSHPRLVDRSKSVELKNANGDILLVVPGEKLKGAELPGAKLAGVVLTGHACVNMNLSDADLQRAVLKGVPFHNADLRRANLEHADLTEANVFEANFSNAKLAFAKLIRVNVSGADFRGADLTGCDFTDAYYDHATKWPTGFDFVKAGTKSYEQARREASEALEAKTRAEQKERADRDAVETKERARRQAEEQQKRQREAGLEEERRERIREQRRIQKQCVMCGEALGLFARLTGAPHHRGCNSFRG